MLCHKSFILIIFFFFLFQIQYPSNRSLPALTACCYGIRHLKTTGTLSMPAPRKFNVGRRPKIWILNHESPTLRRMIFPGFIPAWSDSSLKEHARSSLQIKPVRIVVSFSCRTNRAIQLVVKKLACVSWHLLRTLFQEWRYAVIDVRVAGTFPKNSLFADTLLCFAAKIAFVQF